MAIGSKYNPLGSEQKPRAERIFTDRVDSKDAFRKSIAHINEISKDKDGKEKNTYKVLAFYGMGGIGKTSLRDHLCDMIKKNEELKKHVVYSYIDFQTDFPKDMISKDVFYRLISDRFHKNFGIKFTIFSLAYIIYLKKLNPNLELKKHTLPFAEEGDILSGIIEFLSESVGSIAGITTKIVAYAYKNYSNFFLDDNIKKELVELENQEVCNIEQELSRFFAYDLANFKKENPNKKVAIFFDTYELLCKTQPTDAEKLKQDEWIRDFIEQNKNVLFVISGREKLIWELADSDWEEVLEQHRLEELSDDDCKSFLNHCGITDPNIQERIIKCSCGVPFYLDICVEIWENDKGKEDFKDIKQTEITERLIRYLDRSELATLELLSIASYFDKEIFELIVSKFSTGYPATKIDELAKFSFISSEDNSKHYTIQRLMKECLQNQLDVELKARAHETMVCYYEDKLKDLSIKTASRDNAILVREAFIHKENLNGEEKAIDWLLEKLDIYSERGVLFIFKDMLLELLNRDFNYKKADVLNNLGTSYYSLGNYNKAIEYYKKALEIRINTLDENHPDVASSYNNLGAAYNGLGDYNKAIYFFEKALEIKINTLGENHPNVASSYNNLGAAYNDLGDYNKAIEYHEKALEIRINTLDENHSDLATSYNNLGAAYNNLGDYNKAIEYYKKALEIRINTLDENHPDLATSYYNLGISYDGLEDYGKAIEYYKKALEIRINTLDENHPDIASSYNNLGVVYNDLGDYNKAIEYHEKPLEIRINTLGENHPDVADSYNNLGISYDGLGDYNKAIECHEKALEIRINTQGKNQNHRNIIRSYVSLGGIYYGLGDYSKAIEYYEKALEIRINTLDENHPDIVNSYYKLGAAYNGLGDYNKAISFLEKALEIRINTPGESHPDIVNSYYKLGAACNGLGDYNKAIEYHEKALEIEINTLGENHPDVADSYGVLGGIYYGLGDYSKAIEYYEKALEIRINTLGRSHPDIADYYNNLGVVYNDLGDYCKAIEYYEKALEIRINILGENDPDITFYYSNIGESYHGLGDYGKAIEYYEKALEIIETVGTLYSGKYSDDSNMEEAIKKEIAIIREKLIS